MSKPSELFTVAFEIKPDGTLGQILCEYQSTGLKDEELLYRIAKAIVTGFEMQELGKQAQQIINPEG